MCIGVSSHNDIILHSYIRTYILYYIILFRIGVSARENIERMHTNLINIHTYSLIIVNHICLQIVLKRDFSI